ncbi:MAG: nucleotidyltransferase domain-containing protein [Bacteroidetes bacterium]|nr:nucleotidyltransferase domain-containing protein [Bacteroidota bacterium]
MSVHIKTFDELTNLLRKENIFEKFGLSKIGVFGSFIRGEKYNDIDLLIEDNIEYEQRISLKQTLEKLLNTKIDIVIKKYAEPIILFRALREIKYATRN